MLLVSIVLIYLLYLTKDLSKMDTIMVGVFAGSSGMATVFKATPLQSPLCDSMAKGTVEGFFIIMSISKEKH
jgi:hypothetical protein